MTPRAETSTNTRTPDRLLNDAGLLAFSSILSRSMLDLKCIQQGTHTQEDLDARIPKRGRETYIYLSKYADGKYQKVWEQIKRIGNPNGLIDSNVTNQSITQDEAQRMKAIAKATVTALNHEAFPDYLDIVADFTPPEDIKKDDLERRVKRVAYLQAHTDGTKATISQVYKSADTPKEERVNTTDPQELGKRIALKIAAATPKEALQENALTDETKTIIAEVASELLETTEQNHTLVIKACDEAMTIIRNAIPASDSDDSTIVFPLVIDRMKSEIALSQATVTPNILATTIRDLEKTLIVSPDTTAPNTVEVIVSATADLTAENKALIEQTLETPDAQKLLGRFSKEKLIEAYQSLMNNPIILRRLSIGAGTLAVVSCVLAVLGYLDMIPRPNANAYTEPTYAATPAIPTQGATDTLPQPTDIPRKSPPPYTPIAYIPPSPTTEPSPSPTRRVGPPPPGPTSESIFLAQSSPEQDLILSKIFKLFEEKGLQILIPGYSDHLHGLPDPLHPKDGPDPDDFRGRLIPAPIKPNKNGEFSWPDPRDPVYNHDAGFHSTGNIVDNNGQPIALEGDIIIMSHNINILANIPGSQVYGIQSLSLVNMQPGQLIYLTDNKGKPVATYKVIHKDRVSPDQPMASIFTLHPDDQKLGTRLFVISCDDQTPLDLSTLNNDRQVVTAELVGGTPKTENNKSIDIER